MELELHPAAEAEARAAVLRYRAADSSVAERFVAALDNAMKRIASAPHRWPQHLQGTQRLVLRRFPFAVIYRVSSDRVLVIAIAHQRRRPVYWHHRG